MDQNASWEANRFAASQEIPRILLKPKIQSTPAHLTFWRYVLISFHLRLGLPSGLFPSEFPTKTLYTPLSSPSTLHARPSHFSRFYHPHNIGSGVQIMKLLIMKFSALPCYLVLLGPNIVLNTLFSNTLSLCPSLMSATKFHTHTEQIYIYIYIYIYVYVTFHFEKWIIGLRCHIKLNCLGRGRLN
jgi:hypothetical protein